LELINLGLRSGYERISSNNKIKIDRKRKRKKEGGSEVALTVLCVYW
jgi:hypothetical protein